ncbi:putative retrotransposon hot spot protein (RHS,) [Trypanosoma cruzi]|uniref:Putative retrotransposon hot spot protein (RHS,) n=1 Tax=Trypanosoma cruzi TaxID=5693 RepID=A0A2V2VC11_TRYCR|nr:putative retrotransposon hot spot protein (RHS,) [Trypanosoma cruzi]
MAHRPSRRASATPNAIGAAGRNSRDGPLEPAAPAGSSWAVRVGCFTARGVVMAPRRGSSGGSDAATCRGVAGTRRQEWTMSSTVEDILLEGSTNRTDISDMKLNDFLRSNLGGRGVVDTNENVHDAGVCSGSLDVFKKRNIITHNKGIAVVPRAGGH